MTKSGIFCTTSYEQVKSKDAILIAAGPPIGWMKMDDATTSSDEGWRDKQRKGTVKS